MPVLERWKVFFVPSEEPSERGIYFPVTSASAQERYTEKGVVPAAIWERMLMLDAALTSYGDQGSSMAYIPDFGASHVSYKGKKNYDGGEYAETMQTYRFLQENEDGE